MADAIEPAEKQIEACEGWGWKFDGVNMFERGRMVGYFNAYGWQTITMEEFCNGRG